MAEATEMVEVQVGPDETLDRLTSKLRILQKRRGHRAASDDTLLAWAAVGACPGAKRVLDLGSGKGTVAMLLLQRLPDCRVVGLEVLEASHDLALRNSHLNRLSGRWEPRLGDLRNAAVLEGEPPFDLVTGAPPFMRLGTGVLPADLQRQAGRFEIRGGARDYVVAAARHLAAAGAAVILMDGQEPSRLRTEEAILESGLHVASILSVHPAPGRPPTYRIFTAVRGNAPPRSETLCMRAADGGGSSVQYNSIRREMDVANESPPDNGTVTWSSAEDPGERGAV